MKTRFALAALALGVGLTACASGPPEPYAPPKPAQADLAAATAWRQAQFVEPVLAAASACARLAQGQAAFNESLVGAGLKPAANWQSRTGFLEAPPFDAYRSPDLTLRFTANLVNGEAVCLLRFEGRLGLAAWEDHRSYFLTLPAWTSFAPAEAPFFFEKTTPEQVTSFNFIPQTDKAKPGLMIEVRPPEKP